MRTNGYSRFHIDYCGKWFAVFGRAHSHLLLIELHKVERKRKTLSKKQAAQFQMTTKNTDDLPQKRKCPMVNPMQTH